MGEKEVWGEFSGKMRNRRALRAAGEPIGKCTRDAPAVKTRFGFAPAGSLGKVPTGRRWNVNTSAQGSKNVLKGLRYAVLLGPLVLLPLLAAGGDRAAWLARLFGSGNPRVQATAIEGNLQLSEATRGTLTRVHERLTDLGASRILLESWGHLGQSYRFRCDLAEDLSQPPFRTFQATDADPDRAMYHVLDQVESWCAERRMVGRPLH